MPTRRITAFRSDRASMRSVRHPHDSDSSDNASETPVNDVVVLISDNDEEEVNLHSSSASLRRRIDTIVLDGEDEEPAESVSERDEETASETKEEEEEELFAADGPALFDTVPALSQFEHVADAATRRWLQRRPLAPSRLVRHKVDYLTDAMRAALGIGHRPLSAAQRDFLKLYHAHPSVLCWRLSLAAVRHYGADRIAKRVRVSPLVILINT
jgi:hypothetical protein